MSEATTLAWVGGEHEFLLTIGGIRAVQTACNAGPLQIVNRLQYGLWHIDDILAPIRHGLIGGGMAQDEARALVDRMVDAHPLAAFVTTAHLILAAAVVGVPDDPPSGTPVSEEAGEPDAGETPGTPPSPES